MGNPEAGNAALDQRGSQRGGKKWPDLSCMLEVEPTSFADGWGVREERRGIRDAS